MNYIRHVKPFYIDERGEMSHLLNEIVKIESVLLIVCKKGAIRANHYHKKDIHYSYILKGSMEYTYQELNKKNAKKKTLIVQKGDMVKTPPMVAHAMRFLEESVFLALTTEPRGQTNYERDTVKISLIPLK